MVRAVQFILFFTLLSFNSCLEDKQTSVTENIYVVYNDTFFLDIDKNNKIFRVSFVSHQSSQNYNYEFIYYNDSIVKISTYAASAYNNRTTFFLTDGRADSCVYYSGNIPQHFGKDYFLYDQNGYLISKTEKRFDMGNDNSSSYTTSFDYQNGNLIKMTFDPKKLTLSGKYITYTCNSSQNLINIETFTGDWLGKINKNLVQRKYTGDSMLDTPPCSTFVYTFRSDGLVDKKTVRSCNLPSNYSTIITFEYNFIDL